LSLAVTMQGSGDSVRTGEVYLYVGDNPAQRSAVTTQSAGGHCFFGDPARYTCQFDIPRGKTASLIVVEPWNENNIGNPSGMPNGPYPAPVNAADTMVVYAEFGQFRGRVRCRSGVPVSSRT
jgi:hypothetical protein